jgi:hypothetical protein
MELLVQAASADGTNTDRIFSRESRWGMSGRRFAIEYPFA